MLAALVKANGVPGMGAAIVSDGVVIWHGSAGMRDVEGGAPVDRHTVFRLASVSKLVTATAAAKLGEAGLLDLDAPVQSSLPWLKASWAPLTPRQLAAHTSGLPHYQEADEARGAKRYKSVQEAVGIFEGRPLLAPPGSAYRYSSWGYTLLSAVVETAAGKPFLDYLAQDITHGLVIVPDGAVGDDPEVSKTYGFADGRAVRLPTHDFSYTWGGGGLAATPEAIALFGSRVASGELVSHATFQSMLQPARLTDGTAASEREYEVGVGWRTGRDVNGETIAHHAGVTEGARSALLVWPKRSVSVSLLSNAQWTSSIERTAEMLAAPFLETRVRGGPSPTGCPIDAVAFEGDFEGKRLEGAASFAEIDGLCKGRIVLPPGSLRSWFNDYPQGNADALEIIGIHWKGGLGRAALVTPIGLFDLRGDRQGLILKVQFGPTRSLAIRLKKRSSDVFISAPAQRPSAGSDQ